MGLSLGAGCVCFALGAVWLLWPSADPTGVDDHVVRSDDRDSVGTSGESPPNRSAGHPRSTSAPATAVDPPDDGVSLWASPTNGSPCDLSYAPAGGQLFAIFRPAELLEQREGRKIVQALGASFQQAREEWEQITGLQLERVSQLIWIAIPADGHVDFAQVIRFAIRDGDNSLPAFPSRQGSWSFWSPAEPGVVVGSNSQLLLDEIQQNRGVAPPLRRDLENLLSVTDATRHVSLLFTPSFLKRQGRVLIPAQTAGLWDGLLTIIGDDVRAGLLSLHVVDDQEFFAEARLTGSFGPRERLRLRTADGLQRALRQAAAAVSGREVAEHWRRLAERFGTMVSFVESQLRFGGRNRDVIVNVSLPARAAHNLVLIAELASAERAVRQPAPAEDVPPVTLTDLLNAKVDFRFAQLSLEQALDQLSQQVLDRHPQFRDVVTFKVDGASLQIAGITRNQQINDFDARDARLSRILTQLMVLANPDKSATSAKSPTQTLIWTVTGQNGAWTILTTTREAATRKAYRIPRDFRNT